MVEGPIDKPEAILKLIEEISSISNTQFIIRSINYSYVNGWEVTSDKTLIRFGNNFLFSGEWWITFFPAIFLVILALSINLLGDWMRDALNPKLKKR